MMNEPDVAIIGGGLTGLSTAYYLSKYGQKVILIELCNFFCRYKYIILTFLALSISVFGADLDSAIFGKDLIPNILGYDKEGSLKLGALFTLLQSTYFKPIFFGVLFGVPFIFFLHYKINNRRNYKKDTHRFGKTSKY